jgi:hypothetical protein
VPPPPHSQSPSTSALRRHGTTSLAPSPTHGRRCLVISLASPLRSITHSQIDAVAAQPLQIAAVDGSMPHLRVSVLKPSPRCYLTSSNRRRQVDVVSAGRRRRRMDAIAAQPRSTPSPHSRVRRLTPPASPNRRHHRINTRYGSGRMPHAATPPPSSLGHPQETNIYNEQSEVRFDSLGLPPPRGGGGGRGVW